MRKRTDVLVEYREKAKRFRRKPRKQPLSNPAFGTWVKDKGFSKKGVKDAPNSVCCVVLSIVSCVVESLNT